MTTYRNTAKGARGIRLTDGRCITVDPGNTATVEGDKVQAVAAGLIETNPETPESDLPDPPADLAPVEAELKKIPYPANLVLIEIGDQDEHTVSAPWLDEPETYADAPTAEARQAELREIGPPEGWTHPLDRDKKDGPGGSLKQDPPALSGMNKAQLIDQAQAEGISIEQIKGTGRNGAVTNDDIRGAIEAKRAEANAPA